MSLWCNTPKIYRNMKMLILIDIFNQMIRDFFVEKSTFNDDLSGLIIIVNFGPK